MVRFLHTADWQMGMQARHVGRVAEKVRQVRLESAAAVVQVASERRVDFILVAGDTFEDNAVSGVLVQQVADILAGFGGPVYIIPGNHDPLVPGSVWEHPAWQAGAGLHVLRSSEPVEIGQALLFPCPITDKFSRADPTAWIEAGPQTKIRIGLAHGSVQDVVAGQTDFPIPAGAARNKHLDYLALGHWHSTFVFGDGGGDGKMAYCGTHEATRFGERDSGNVLLVEISAPGANPRIETVATGRLKWQRLERQLQGFDDYQLLTDELENRPRAGDTLLELVLSGLLVPRARSLLERIQELISARFFYGRIDDSLLEPSPDDSEWIENLPAGYIRQAGRMLLEQATSGVQEQNRVARAALMELFTIAGQVGR